VAIACNENSRVNQFGECEICDPGKEASADGKFCVPKSCPAGYQLSADKRICEKGGSTTVVGKPSSPTPTSINARMKDISLLSITPLDRLLN